MRVLCKKKILKWSQTWIIPVIPTQSGVGIGNELSLNYAHCVSKQKGRMERGEEKRIFRKDETKKQAIMKWKLILES